MIRYRQTPWRRRSTRVLFGSKGSQRGLSMRFSTAPPDGAISDPRLGAMQSVAEAARKGRRLRRNALLALPPNFGKSGKAAHHVGVFSQTIDGIQLHVKNWKFPSLGPTLAFTTRRWVREFIRRRYWPWWEFSDHVHKASKIAVLPGFWRTHRAIAFRAGVGRYHTDAEYQCVQNVDRRIDSRKGWWSLRTTVLKAALPLPWLKRRFRAASEPR